MKQQESSKDLSKANCCTHCKKTFDNRGALKEHLESHLSNMQKIFTRPAQISRKSSSNVCHLCRKECGTQGGLVVHLKTHLSAGVCEVCSREFLSTPGSTAQQKLWKHKQTCGQRPPPAQYSCLGCNQQFSNKDKKTRHERKCLPPHCEECGQGFKNYSLLGRHKCPKFELKK